MSFTLLTKFYLLIFLFYKKLLVFNKEIGRRIKETVQDEHFI